MSGTPPQTVTPQYPNPNLKDVKEIINTFIVLCNSNLANYQKYKIFEPGDIKAELEDFYDNFSNLFYNSGDLLPQVIKDDEKMKKATDMCVKIESWLNLEHYELDADIRDIFRDGILLFREYKKILATTRLYEAAQ